MQTKYLKLKKKRKKRGGGSLIRAIFCAQNYVSGQSANSVEYGMCHWEKAGKEGVTEVRSKEGIEGWKEIGRQEI